MSAIAFDTHRIVKRLKEVGFSDLQAEAVTDVLGESRGQAVDLSGLATKADLAGFATKTDLSILATRAEIAHLATKAEISEMKADILKWVMGAIGLQTIVVVGAVVTLARAL